jgi:3-oxoacyl-[acyl-carrier protein] reductase
MATRLAGKIALVTGAARGIGQEIALRLAREGAVVGVHYGASRAKAGAVLRTIEAEGGDGFLVGADIGNMAEIEKLFAEVKSELTRRGVRKLDILVNNAGVGGLGSVTNAKAADFDRIFAVNVRGTLFVTQHALEMMGEGGRIINLSSVVGHRAYPDLIAYAASKAAINSMTRSMAWGLGPRKITVNAIAPGMTDTDMNARALANESFVADRISRTALGAIGVPQDIAGAIAFLASDDGKWITGETIAVSGGMHLD